ncbi:MAG: PHP domain-containing protein [Phycisphaerae bacterium]|nr:PHP domain-containing protein [Phycisphaerae bacterium]
MRPACLALILAALSTSLTAAQEPTSRPERLTIFKRLSLAQLARFDRDRAAFAQKVKPADVPYPFVRGTFHMHSELSHDSNGKISEIIAAAKATRTRVVGMTDHPSKTVDVVKEGAKGWKDGVYFLAGVEGGGALDWPAVQGEADLRFVSHPEEVPTFDRSRFAGMEIYNTHSDAKDEPMKKLLAAVLLNLPAVKTHTDAAFESFLDYPAGFMARYDKLTIDAPFSGIAANDCHQNISFTLVAMPDETVEIFDYSEDRISKVDGMPAKILRSVFGPKGQVTKPTPMTSLSLDPYERGMRHVGTFLQISEVSERTVRHALRTGRVILGFEIVAPLPSVGFWIERDGKPAATVGDQLPWQPGLSLRCALPAEARIRIVRNGKPVHETLADACALPLSSGGVYRMEACVTLAGEQWPWVISNPIYVEQAAAATRPK